MKLYHITKQGNLHFQLQDGRLAAVYPSTGYVRVSGSMKNFMREEFKQNRLRRLNAIVDNKNPGNVTMWPINKRVKTKTMTPAGIELFYRTRWSGGRENFYKYPQPVFYAYETSKCELYPNDIVKLMDVLTEFEAKNC
jgi:hypothetical protein